MNLYTKYRSQKFADVVGQEQVARVLTNAIALDRVGHAYLFSGPRGTGKTTLARLLAKSLNCQKRKKGEIEPCGDCPSCREINMGTSMDIIEIDAASNRGIDEIRALRDNARFAASGTRYKIFIIDEVHMLTREAFNALLKTLEEPPKHVIFIMATTESHKVPETILSRTLSFDFHLHKLQDIIKQIEMIAKKEGIAIDSQSIRMIAQNAKGGMRDAITILDQVSASSKKIDEKLTREVLGLSSFESLALCVRCIFEQDSIKALKLLQKLYKDGVDFYQFSLELVELTQKIMLYKVGLVDALDSFTKEEKATILKIVQRVEVAQIVKIVETLLKSANETKDAQMVELPLELAIVELTRSEERGASSDADKFEIRNKKYETSTKEIKNVKQDKERSHPERNEVCLPARQGSNTNKNFSSTGQNDNTKKEKKEVGRGSLDGGQEIGNGSRDVSQEVGSEENNLKITHSGQENQKSKTQIEKEKNKPTTHNPQSTSSTKINFEQIQDKWPKFLKEFDKENGIKTFLENSVPVEIQSDKLVIAVQFGFYKDKLESTKKYQKVSEIFEKVYGSTMTLKFKADEKLVKKIDGLSQDDGSDDMLSNDNVLTSDAEDIFK